MRFNRLISMLTSGANNKVKIFFQGAVPLLFCFGFWVAPLTLQSLTAITSAWPEICIFHRLTQWDCPGCGMTRSLMSFFSGNVHLSFYFHPVGPFLGASVVLFWLFSFHRSLWGRSLDFLTRRLRRHSISFLLLVTAWGVLRNL